MTNHCSNAEYKCHAMSEVMRLSVYPAGIQQRLIFKAAGTKHLVLDGVVLQLYRVILLPSFFANVLIYLFLCCRVLLLLYLLYS